LVIGEIVMLLRRIFPRSAAAHEGGWDKSATGSREVRGRTLGIVGYGNIGSQLSMLAEAMGMKVIFFDRTDGLRHGNTEPVESLQDLLTLSDIVSLHVPETPATSGMIGETELRLMKPGSYLINNSRGTVVDLDALAKALRDGHLAGAALDVSYRAIVKLGLLSKSSAGLKERYSDTSYWRFDRRSAGSNWQRGSPKDA
jgi:D-3-phosphoglycerate dehydrogenase